MRSSNRHRAALVLRRLLIALAMTLVVLAGVWFLFPRLSLSSTETGPSMYRVERGEFIHEIIERGEVESASNVEIRSEVKSKGYSGTAILEIVPEGTIVESGDMLVRLDSASLEDERTQQQIVCNTSEAQLIQVQNTYETALIAKREYIEGKYRQEVQAIQNEIIVAKENRDRAKDYHVYSKRLAAKGYVTKLQLDADHFAVEKAENELEAAQIKLEVLERFTKEKQLKQLEADIRTAEAKLKAQEASHSLDLEKLALIESQIEKCVIKAPETGQVVYANITDHHGSKLTIIEEGTMIRERQVIIRLPDPKRMRIKAKVSESKIALVEEQMPAAVMLDAFADLELAGCVGKVGEYPLPTSRYSASVKEYETIVNILDSPPDLRPGLTAEVRIRVEQIPDVLQVPVQAVFEHGARHYCVFRDGQGYRSREVEIGSTNDKVVVINEGLNEGDEVVMGAAAYRDKVDLPELPAEGKTQQARNARYQQQASSIVGKKPA